MKDQLVKKRKILDAEALCEELGVTLAEEETFLGFFLDEVDAEYNKNFEACWKFLKKNLRVRDYKKLRDEYDAKAVIDSRILKDKYKQKLKQYDRMAEKSQTDLARVVDTVASMLPEMKRLLARNKKEFRLSRAHPEVMFENLLMLEELRLVATTFMVIVKNCQKENERHIINARRNSYFEEDWRRNEKIF